VFIGSIVFIDACERPATLFTPTEQAPALPSGAGGTDSGSPPPADSSSKSSTPAPAPSDSPPPASSKDGK
jgi:hypothetical protein